MPLSARQRTLMMTTVLTLTALRRAAAPVTRTAATVTPMLQVGACTYCAYIKFSCFLLQGAHPHAPSDDRLEPAGGALATADAAPLAADDNGKQHSDSAMPGAEAACAFALLCTAHGPQPGLAHGRRPYWHTVVARSTIISSVQPCACNRRVMYMHGAPQAASGRGSARASRAARCSMAATRCSWRSALWAPATPPAESAWRCAPIAHAGLHNQCSRLQHACNEQ